MQGPSVTQTLAWSPDKKYSDRERHIKYINTKISICNYSFYYRWICIYPAYINSKKTLAQGRRIPKDKCVENPTYQEMRDVLAAAGKQTNEKRMFIFKLIFLGLKVGVENKLYSRERSKELLYRGRIRVQLKNDDGSLCNEAFKSKDSIMLHLGEMIPKLKTRQTKSGGEQTQSSGSSTTGGKSKGKGKGGRR